MEELYSQGYGESSGSSGGEELQWESTGQTGTEEAGTWGGEEQGPSQDEPVYEIDGKSYRLSELKELIKGGMLERDYRIKTAQLAEERRQIEQLRQAAEAWNTLQQYPELVEMLRQKVVELLYGQQQQPQQWGQQPVQTEAEDPVVRELNTLKQQLATLYADYQNKVNMYNQYLWQQYYAQREAYAKAQLPQLKEKYPFLYEDEVVAAFTQSQDANLEELAKASHEHWYKFYQERERGAVQKRVENAKARVAAPAARAGGAAGKVSVPTSFDEARRAAIERLVQAGFLSRR